MKIRVSGGSLELEPEDGEVVSVVSPSGRCFVSRRGDGVALSMDDSVRYDVTDGILERDIQVRVARLAGELAGERLADLGADIKAERAKLQEIHVVELEAARSQARQAYDALHADYVRAVHEKREIEKVLEAALRDLRQVTANLTDVQARSTELLEETRRLKNNDIAWSPQGININVRAFFLKYGYPIGEKPKVPSDDVVRIRLKVLVEEFCEVLDACFLYVDEYEEGHSWVKRIEREIKSNIDKAHVLVDLPELAKELGDLDFASEGVRVAFGVNGLPISNLVYTVNISKDPEYVHRKNRYHEKGGERPARSYDHARTIKLAAAKILTEQGWVGTP